jgi:O-antigen chain-terminating methyltransferase
MALNQTLAEFERRLAAEAAARNAQAADELTARIERLEARLDDVLARLDGVEAAARGATQRADHRLDELRMRILRAERRLRSLGDTPSGNGQTDGAPVVASDSGGLDRVFDYFMFEHRFRGSVADIKGRQTAYLDLIRGHENVVDLGCGRGEFVELLSEHGISATGVDSNADMVDFCRDRGLNVVRADLFDYLEGLPDASVGAFFAAQVVEHLSPEQIVRLIELCGRKLRPRGIVILETINPNCPAAMNWFYLDPSHVRPVPAELLRFVAEQDHFRVKGIRFSAPVAAEPGGGGGAPMAPTLEIETDGLPREAQSYQDYALIAERV